MNEHDPLEEILSQFRNTLPPEAVRDSNRAAVLSALEPVGIPKPWWRRSISVPLPVVLATSAALMVSAAAHLLSVGNNTGQSRSALSVDEPDPALVATADSQVEYFETQRYLSGIGVVDRNV